MQLQEFLGGFIPLFGYGRIEQFIKKYKDIENEKGLRECRLSSSFDPAPTLIYLITSDKLGVLP